MLTRRGNAGRVPKGHNENSPALQHWDWSFTTFLQTQQEPIPKGYEFRLLLKRDELAYDERYVWD